MYKYVFLCIALLFSTTIAAKPVTIYQHCSFGGYQVGLAEGNYDMQKLIKKGARNDDISGIKIAKGYKVIVYEHAGFKGRSWTFTKDQACLVKKGVNDVASSIKVLKIAATNTPAKSTAERRNAARSRASERMKHIRARARRKFNQVPKNLYLRVGDLLGVYRDNKCYAAKIIKREDERFLVQIDSIKKRAWIQLNLVKLDVKNKGHWYPAKALNVKRFPPSENINLMAKKIAPERYRKIGPKIPIKYENGRMDWVLLGRIRPRSCP